MRIHHLISIANYTVDPSSSRHHVHENKTTRKKHLCTSKSAIMLELVCACNVLSTTTMRKLAGPVGVLVCIFCRDCYITTNLWCENTYSNHEILSRCSFDLYQVLLAFNSNTGSFHFVSFWRTLSWRKQTHGRASSGYNYQLVYSSLPSRMYRLKQKCHVNEIFVTGCIANGYFANFQFSQCRKSRHYDISVSVSTPLLSSSPHVSYLMDT